MNRTRIATLALTLSICAAGVARAAPPVATPVGPPVDAAAAVADPVRARMRTVAASIDVPTRPEAAAAMTAAEHAALIALARDPGEPVYIRARALGLVGAKRGGPAEALWADARSWPEEALRVQAAWAQLTARLRTSAGLAFATSLLGDADAKLREVGVHGLFLLATPAAVEAARAHRASEPSKLVQKLIDRRLREAGAR